MKRKSFARYFERILITSFLFVGFGTASNAASAATGFSSMDEDLLSLISPEDKGLFEIPYSREYFLEKIFNFNVVLDNPNYKIYRSSLLGKYGLMALWDVLKNKELPFPRTIIYMNKYGYNSYLPPVIGNFAVEEFMGQREYGYKFFHGFDYKMRTYLDGNNPYNPEEDIDGQTYYLMGKESAQLFGKIEDNAPDGGVDSFVRILKLILDKNNSPVLFHCFGGRHRTGMVAMALRYMQGGEWVDGVKTEVNFPSLGKTLALNPAQNEYYQHNKDMFREENLIFIEKFSSDPQFLELQSLYQDQLQATSVR